MSRITTRRYLFILLGFLVAGLAWLLVPGDPYPLAPAMAAVVGLMATWWITEAVPIPVTSVLPLVLFPALGIMEMGDTSAFYGKSTIFLFLGGFVLAIGLQETGLHRRIALTIVSWIGAQPRKLVLGFMLATWFLSMWISNTATVMVMLPIALSILEQAPEGMQGKKKFAVALMLGIAYAADMGGMATVIGTAPNLAYKDILATIFPGAPEVDFMAWLILGFPLSIAFVLSGWFLLSFVVFRLRMPALVENKDLVRQALKDLGPLRRDELLAGLVFGFTALLWITGSNLQLGDDFQIAGWRSTLGLEWVKDETVAMLGAVLLFLLPSRDRPGEQLMTWENARKLPWGILLLFGGGFAIAGGFGSSGLSEMVGGAFASLSGMNSIPLILVVCLVLTFLTEITSNTATTNLVLPILAQAGLSMGIDPRILMLPATFSASCAFMMPVASPTQAIVFGSGHVPIREMIRAGIWFNLLGILLVTLVFLALGGLAFGIDWGTMPEWAVPLPLEAP